MKKIFASIALTIAFPVMAHAQAAQVPTPKADCCEKMKAGMDCMDMAKMDHSKHGMKDGANPHAGHDMSKPSVPAPAVPR